MKRILVTGANKGIGRAIVEAILEQSGDTFVYLGSRDLARGQETASAIIESHPAYKSRVEVVALDVASDASVASARDSIAARLGGDALFGVVNNAGVGHASGKNFAGLVDVNTLGVRRVCEAFLPLLAPNQGRIVNVTSASGPNLVSRCSPERQRFFCDPTLQWSAIASVIEEAIALDGDKAAFAARGLGDGDGYGFSKACANAYTLLLARENPSLRINACTPGFIETDMTRGYAASQQKSPAELGMKPPSAGAKAPTFLLFGEPEGNGRYYGSDAVRSPLDRYRAPGDPPYTGA